MSSQPASIAVIISTYNAANYLRLTLEGYANQSDNNFCIYIADDGSGEEVFSVIDAFKRNHAIPIQHVWQEDKGYLRARIINQAIHLSQEPYIVLTDADCVPLPDMIATHRNMAEKKMLICGSRILLSQTISKQLSGKKTWHTGMSLWQWFKWRRQQYINRLHPLLLPVSTSSANSKLYGIRGCHIAFWKQDIVTVNGFDSSYEGWGREDSDLVARLFHAGVRRKNLRGMPVLHLWHAEASRQQLKDNDALLQTCLNEKRIEAISGLKQI